LNEPDAQQVLPYFYGRETSRPALAQSSSLCHDRAFFFVIAGLAATRCIMIPGDVIARPKEQAIR
jgi:hypothetical protein